MFDSTTPAGEAPREATLRLFARPLQVRSLVLTAVLVLGLGYTLYFARFICIPIALALIFNMLLGPLVTCDHIAELRPLGRALGR